MPAPKPAIDLEAYLARVGYTGSRAPDFARAVLDGVEYLVDVGFGPQGPPYPVLLHHAPDAHARYRVVELGDVGFRLEVRDSEDWKPLYRFDDVPYGQADAELGHFYSHRHPEAAFVNNLVASRILDDEVRSLRNREYHVIRADDTDVEVITDATRLHAILTDELRLQVSTEEASRLFEDCAPQ